MDSEFESSVMFLVKDVPGDDSSMLASAIVTEFRQRADATSGFEMLDPSVTGEGGAAFLWEDVLALGDLVDAVTPMMSLYSPNEVAAIIGQLLTAWIKLRRVRVTLDENEMRVMRAIKRGMARIPAIADYTGLTPEQVEKTLEQLRAKRYKEDIRLVEGDNETLSTRF